MFSDTLNLLDDAVSPLLAYLDEHPMSPAQQPALDSPRLLPIFGTTCQVMHAASYGGAEQSHSQGSREGYGGWRHGRETQR